MFKVRGQQKESQTTDDGGDALWEALQNKGGQQWVAGHREEEAGEIMMISLVKDLVGGQSLKEWKTMIGVKCSFSVNVTVDGKPVSKPEF